MKSLVFDFLSMTCCTALGNETVKVYRISGSVNGLVAQDSSGRMTALFRLEHELVSQIMASAPVEDVFTLNVGNSICVTTADGECQSSEEIFRNAAAACAAGATTGLAAATPRGVASGCPWGAAGALTYWAIYNAGCTPPPPPPPSNDKK